MTRFSRSLRVFVALGVSVALNLVWLALDAGIDWQRYPLSKPARIVEGFGKPGGAVGNWLAPGHGAILLGVTVAVVSSVLFYAVLVWIFLSLLNWWASHHPPDSN